MRTCSPEWISQSLKRFWSWFKNGDEEDNSLW
jgi:hypothetical protein